LAERASVCPQPVWHLGWVAVPAGEAVGDVTPESGLAREARPTKRSAGEDAEETLDLVEPTGTPLHHLERRMCRGIVDDDVQVDVLVRARELLEKGQKVSARLPARDPVDAFAGRNL
jgi:hypothetical protein